MKLMRYGARGCGVQMLAAFAFAVAVTMSAILGGAVALASDEPPQVKLTEPLVKNFIAMQSDLLAMAKELEAAVERPNKEIKSRVIALAKKNGFASFDEFDAVAISVTLVIAGIDPDTGEWTDPKIGIKADMEDVKADQTLSDEERAELLEDLRFAIANTPDIAHPENIAIVKSYAVEIEKVLQ